MLQRNENGDDDRLILRLVDVDAILVMDGKHLLADDCDDLPGLVIQFEIQAGDVSLKDPSESFDV